MRRAVFVTWVVRVCKEGNSRLITHSQREREKYAVGLTNNNTHTYLRHTHCLGADEGTEHLGRN